MGLTQFEKTVLKFKRAASLSSRSAGDVLVIPCLKKKDKAELAADIGKLKSGLRNPLKTGDFTGALGETLLLYPSEEMESRFLLLGLGEKDILTVETFRRAYAAAIKALNKKSVAKAAFIFPEVGTASKKDLLKGLVEGILLAHYRFEGYALQKKDEGKIKEATLIGINAADLKDVEHVRSLVKGVYLARDLVNRNADEVNPRYLEGVAKALGKGYPQIRTKILHKKNLEKEKMGLLLAVGRGASTDPALIICEYRGDPKSKKKIALVGKGVTYDTGGLNLKKDMLTMKCDMGGAAACLGLLFAAASTKLKQNIIAVIPATENSIGSKSYKPGDVYMSYSGKSVEIGNTDAEGRLILADALSYVCKNFKPDLVIDLATLTGAMVVSLGSEYTGLMSNDETISDALVQAGRQTYERVCPFPLIEEYRDKMKSDIADLKNVSGREAGSIKAALLLSEFVADVPWAHLDIAGTAFISEGRDYLSKYATGVGVRLLMQFLESR